MIRSSRRGAVPRELRAMGTGGSQSAGKGAAGRLADGAMRGVPMPSHIFLVVVITLILAAAFLFIWMRRDRGEFPQDRLPEALHEPLDGVEHASGRHA